MSRYQRKIKLKVNSLKIFFFSRNDLVFLSKLNLKSKKKEEKCEILSYYFKFDYVTEKVNGNRV